MLISPYLLARWTSHQASCPIPIGVGTPIRCALPVIWTNPFFCSHWKCPCCWKDRCPWWIFPLQRKSLVGYHFDFLVASLAPFCLTPHDATSAVPITLCRCLRNGDVERLPLSSMSNHVVRLKPTAVDSSADVKQAQDSSAKKRPTGRLFCPTSSECGLSVVLPCKSGGWSYPKRPFNHVSDSTWKVFSLMS